ncbi:hypothetical protein [Flavobacterium hungaricum]|uniref:Uncharacterized protein n=1 Tax=Flavobacterium hungaricum TaxID=2082725 RepID=A0ABR9TJE8_9FLAO|nr:hypothetical protein [Flavobacterium hungaricum]MBE8725491.1 hypothetical protein [Flavobacterium hungaricum]
MRNLLMLLVAVLGTSAMVQAFPAKTKTEPAKEVKAPGKQKAKADKKVKSEKKEAPQKETSKKEAPKTEAAKAKK